MKLRCVTHQIEVETDPEHLHRKVELPYVNWKPCELLRRHPIPIGQVGACVIEVVEEGQPQ